jgi:transcriptional regulator of acetoin/glycerol metabolism
MRNGDLTRRTVELLVEQLPEIDLSAATDDDLVDAVHRAVHTSHTQQVVAGLLLAELRRRGNVVRELAKLVDIPKSTLHRWARPFLARSA